VFVCAIGAACQGWDQTGSNGASEYRPSRTCARLIVDLSFPAEFGIAIPFGQPGGGSAEWKVGFVNSAPYISAALAGVWREFTASTSLMAVSDPLNNWFGRRGEIFITAIILIATPIASGFTHSWQALLAVRLIMGLGLGAKGV